ncbi:Mms19p [Ilyonectria robusta]
MDENIGPRPPGSHAALPTATAASSLLANFMPYEPISRATSPGIPCSKSDEDDKKRYRPRTFAYFQQLPFQVEEEA